MDELLDCKLIWEKAQPEIKEGMTEMSYSLWISGLEPVCILSDMLILQSMNEVTLDTLKSLYSDQIADALSHASGVNLRPMFICGDERPKYEKLMAENNAELAKQYGVKQAPTLVITKDGGFEKYAGAGAIRNYISQ
mgnify:CR=1 FL=1